MGHRLSKIVTRTGDAGETGLGDGSRVAKDSPRIEAIGTVDELNSVLGVLLAEPLPEAIAACLTDVQHDLFDLGGELSIPGHFAITDAHVARVEVAVEAFFAMNGRDPATLDELVPSFIRESVTPRWSMQSNAAGGAPILTGLDVCEGA
jgi:cob(I)alamin adenosyltransferase